MNQEYYYGGGYVTIWGDVKDKPDMVIVSENNDYGDLVVVSRSELVKKEDSYTYKQAEKRADELRAITAKAEENFDNIVDKVIEAACKSLAMRMKMNVLFGEGLKGDKSWAVLVSDELEKLIKEEAKDIVKK